MFWVCQEIAPFESTEEKGSDQVRTIQKIRLSSWMKTWIDKTQYWHGGWGRRERTGWNIGVEHNPKMLIDGSC